MPELAQLKFFLGANTPQGFYSLFDELYNPQEDDRLFIIKGGPGTGKSGLMRNVAALVEQKGYRCERILCSSDPDSLDGVIFPELHAAIADGTAPHVLNPYYPGVVEQLVDLGAFWDASALRKQGAEIRRLITANGEEHRRSVQFLAAVQAIDNDSLRTVGRCIDRTKVENYAKRLAGREFADKTHAREGRGKEQRRFLSAITPQGICVLRESVGLVCDRVFAVRDEYGACASLLLHALKENALSRGLDVVACYCPLRPKEKLEHLLIPALGIAFVTENAYHAPGGPVAKRIHTKRFLDTAQLSESICRLRFNARARRELLEEAVCRLELAKSIHDKLETYYIGAMDFSGYEALARRIAEEIVGS